jgi:hypothetical protein
MREGEDTACSSAAGLVCAILCASALVAFALLTRGHDWGDDFAAYILQAKSVVEHGREEFIRRSAFTIEHSSITIGPVVYPWGYPLLLAPFYWVAGLDLVALKLPGLALFIGFLCCTYFMFGGRLSRGDRVVVVLVFAFSPAFLGCVDQVLSDVPFAFFACLTLGLIIRQSAANGRAAIVRGVAVGVSAAAALMVRTIGIALIAAFVAQQASRAWADRQDSTRLIAGLRCSVAAATAFTLLTVAGRIAFPASAGRSYVEQFAASTGTLHANSVVALGKVFLRSGAYYWELLPGFFAGIPEAGLACTAAIAFAAAGAWARRRKDGGLLTFAVMYATVLLAWPSQQGIRFVLPLLPLFVYFAIQGMRSGARTMFGERSHWTGFFVRAPWVALAIAFLSLSAPKAYANLRSDRRAPGAFDDESAAMYRFIGESTPSDAKIVFFKPRLLRLVTSRDALAANTCAELVRGNVAVEARWANGDQLQLSAGNQCGVALEVAYTNASFIVYRFDVVDGVARSRQ